MTSPRDKLKRENKRGPSTESCGTPGDNLHGTDMRSFYVAWYEANWTQCHAMNWKTHENGQDIPCCRLSNSAERRTRTDNSLADLAAWCFSVMAQGQFLWNVSLLSQSGSDHGGCSGCERERESLLYTMHLRLLERKRYQLIDGDVWVIQSGFVLGFFFRLGITLYTVLCIWVSKWLVHRYKQVKF